MGSEVAARCQCGLETYILVGGGMADCIGTCYFPCFCESCHNVVQVNVLAEEKQCPQCKTNNVIPYDDPSLSQRSGRLTVVSWDMKQQLGRDLALTNGRYRCPQCNQMTLRFTDSRLYWD